MGPQDTTGAEGLLKMAGKQELNTIMMATTIDLLCLGHIPYQNGHDHVSFPHAFPRFTPPRPNGVSVPLPNRKFASDNNVKLKRRGSL